MVTGWEQHRLFGQSLMVVQQIFARGVQSQQAAQLTNSSKDCLDPVWSHDGESIYYPRRSQPVDRSRFGGQRPVGSRRNGCRRHSPRRQNDRIRARRGSCGLLPFGVDRRGSSGRGRSAPSPYPQPTCGSRPTARILLSTTGPFGFSPIPPASPVSSTQAWRTAVTAGWWA